MQPGQRVAVDETQVEISPPIARLRRLAYALVANTTGAACYLSVWAGSGTSRTAAQRTQGPWYLPADHYGPVLIELQASGGAVLAVHTAAGLTGAPSSALELVPFWE
jgi:hypothetical protein